MLEVKARTLALCDRFPYAHQMMRSSDGETVFCKSDQEKADHDLYRQARFGFVDERALLVDCSYMPLV
ncbi:hypothetical protein SAMN05216228_1022122 [Rhizobium tibeticum]|uniref:Uncharacterized protein n=1 Tax=Rhizobium tibeticum TaxID=501024 RepID=A0A1H8RY70_9HYPH|nr:hypothetical protein RTCCBAU85039_4282 [Rhizobium tibeticum]SEO71154.1 hypothetical protein SAMN05216228_1022122 [Rhizobium tibeticum]